MAAQPVSHLFVTGWLSATPHAPWPLVVVVSCVPPLVFGHLLHLAATPVSVSSATAATSEAVSAESAAEAETETPVPPTEPEAETRDDDPETRGFLTPRQVAERYGVSVSTVRTWKDRGKIMPAFTDPRLGNMYDPETLPPIAAVG